TTTCRALGTFPEPEAVMADGAMTDTEDCGQHSRNPEDQAALANEPGELRRHRGHLPSLRTGSLGVPLLRGGRAPPNGGRLRGAARDRPGRPTLLPCAMPTRTGRRHLLPGRTPSLPRRAGPARGARGRA